MTQIVRARVAFYALTIMATSNQVVNGLDVKSAIFSAASFIILALSKEL